ncbi:PREDICTED: olfactory receptor 14A16-like [Gekko japonicus]|uniref:Olfactory receptor n=1 Tax=Gekko japonicus TaxID=146911 RepID=A0ABM1KNR6_GEKJA|nr:PREDICTED: olfactory receptor 14A16-like [Gekko japonicus]
MASLIANILVFTVIATGHHIHTPMYFFLMNLSIIDIGSISITLPKAMANSFLNTRLISYYECAAQVFFLFFFLSSEWILLTIMAYDRYAAICDPLNYGRVMNRRFCFQMAMSAWIGGLLYGIVNVTSTFLITFCSRVINQFFCEVPHLLRLSCSNLYLIEIGVLIVASCICTCCLGFIAASYVYIFRTVLGITSVEGNSTCIPHLIVVSLFLTVGMIAHLKPASSSPSNWDLALSLMYTVVPPTLNPIIYTIRNKEIKAEISKVIYWAVHVNRKMAVF